ncbi:hypothetical protein CEXT_611141 [Caerostris extrusa]|uniref:Uncharacterized protein n=1 Tax=Caerostris extrusa TaxID=172846 RepID=A0AAV4TAA6_CAEEX|nr:hypothetical protein CEXT_611141 [Caerostris extrusa]
MQRSESFLDLRAPPKTSEKSVKKPGHIPTGTTHNREKGTGCPLAGIPLPHRRNGPLPHRTEDAVGVVQVIGSALSPCPRYRLMQPLFLMWVNCVPIRTRNCLGSNFNQLLLLLNHSVSRNK